MAASKEVSKHIVNSRRVTSLGLSCQMAMSNRRSVVLVGRSVTILVSGGRYGLMKSTILVRTESWQWLYYLSSKVTGQSFRTCMRVCFSLSLSLSLSHIKHLFEHNTHVQKRLVLVKFLDIQVLGDNTAHENLPGMIIVTS